MRETCPTRTPGTSVTPLCAPVGQPPIPVPRSRTLQRRMSLLLRAVLPSRLHWPARSRILYLQSSQRRLLRPPSAVLASQEAEKRGGVFSFWQTNCAFGG